MLDPELDPVKLLEEDGPDAICAEAQNRLEPRALAAYAYTQLDAVSRLPRRAATAVDRLESGTIQVGIVPSGLEATNVAEDGSSGARSVVERQAATKGGSDGG